MAELDPDLKDFLDSAGKVVAAAKRARLYQNQYYGGNKGLLVTCKQAEKDLDDALGDFDFRKNIAERAISEDPEVEIQVKELGAIISALT